MSTDLFDVAVIGAGPAGAAAAGYLAGHKLAVALVDGSTARVADGRAGWLSPRARPLLKELNVKFKEGVDEAASVNDVTFYNAEFTKTARPKFTEHVGSLVDRNEFGGSLREAAKAHGATLIENCAAGDVRLNEKEVVISLADGRKISSRLLVLATGRGSTLTSRLGFRSEIGESPLWIAQVEGRTKKGTGDGGGKVGIVLGLDGGNGFSWCAAWRDRAIVNVNLIKNAGQVHKQLESVCRAASTNGLVPIDLSSAAGKSPVYRSPAGAALDLETHVAKHTLLIGDAGGFVSSSSNEGLYPAMWSAKLAAETIVEALTTRFSQDTLMSFDSKWRMQMADYLRSPHTDVRFLLPLIFSNQPMADRMGAAFFFGENM